MIEIEIKEIEIQFDSYLDMYAFQFIQAVKSTRANLGSNATRQQKAKEISKALLVDCYEVTECGD